MKCTELPLMRAAFASILLWMVVGASGCGGGATTTSCPSLACKLSCGPGGTKKDDGTGCDTCLCAGSTAADAGAACPAIACTDTCGLGNAADPTTGCATCSCCNPADCEPGGCHGFGADGCPTCGPCH